MIDNQKNKETLQEDAEGLSLMDLLLTFAKYKKVILISPAVFGMVGLVISLIMPTIYKTNTKILPPQQSQSTAASMLAQLGGLAGGAGAALGIKNPNDMYIGILKSQNVTNNLINRFDLKNRYDQKSMESTRKMVEQNSLISSGKDGIITIEFMDEDPKVAAAIANAYVDELVRITATFNLTEASQRRAFFEKQLIQTKNELAATEKALTGALDSRGVISVDAQSKAMLETVARLRAGIAAKEVQLKSMQAFVTPNNAEYKRVNEEINSMRDALAKFENGNYPIGSSDVAKTNEAYAKKGGLDSIQTLRDVKYLTMMYELLVKQYEIARLDEAKNSPSVQVLDVATEPEHKFKPKRAMITVMTAFLGLLIAVGYAFINDSMSAPKSPGQEAKWLKLKEYLRFK